MRPLHQRGAAVGVDFLQRDAVLTFRQIGLGDVEAGGDLLGSQRQQRLHVLR